MSVSHVARRYARAFFELGQDAGELDKIVEAFRALGEAYTSNDELRQALESPLMAIEAKRAILTDLAASLGGGNVLKHALLFLGDRRRTAILPALGKGLVELRDRAKGVVRAEVTAAATLPEDFYEKLRKEAERITGQSVVLERKIDPTLLGGVTLRIGDRILDGSLRTRLSRLKDALLPN